MADITKVASDPTETFPIEKGKTYQIDNVLIMCVNDGDIRWSTEEFSDKNKGKPAFTHWERQMSANRTVYVRSASEMEDAEIQIDTVTP